MSPEMGPLSSYSIYKGMGTMTSESVAAVLWSVELDGVHCVVVFKDGSRGESVLPWEAFLPMLEVLHGY